MAITVLTSAPQELLEKIRSDVSLHQNSEWQADSDGDFTLADPKWRDKAWFRAYVKDRKLVFGIIPSSNPGMTSNLFASYHGQLLSMLLANYDHMFSEASTSPITNKFFDL